MLFSDELMISDKLFKNFSIYVYGLCLKLYFSPKCMVPNYVKVSENDDTAWPVNGVRSICSHILFSGYPLTHSKHNWAKYFKGFAISQIFWGFEMFIPAKSKVPIAEVYIRKNEENFTKMSCYIAIFYTLRISERHH